MSTTAVSNGSSVPTNATVPPEYKKKKLVKKNGQDFTKQKHLAWMVGHASVLVFGLISIVFQLLWLPNVYYINSIAYRLSLLGAVVALFATTAHSFGIYDIPPITTLMSHQNFQYLVLAIVWMVTFKSTFKLMPYILISLLQLASAKKIGFVLKQQDFLASLIAYDELVLIVYLLIRTLLFRNASGYQLSLFLMFYWLRILYNKETGNLFRAIVERLDGKVQNVKNPKVLHAWNKSKAYLEEMEQH